MAHPICQYMGVTSSSIVLGGTGTLFYMMDQYFGNDSLELFECKFISSTGLAMAFIWLRRTCECGGTNTLFHIMVLAVFEGTGVPAHFSI